MAFSLADVRSGMQTIQNASPVTVSLNRDSKIVQGAQAFGHYGREAVKNTYSNVRTFFHDRAVQVSGFFNEVRQAAADRVNRIGTAATRTANQVGTAVTNTAENVKNGVASGIDRTKNGVVALGKAIKDNVPIHVAINRNSTILAAGRKFFKETFPNGVQSVRQGMRNMVEEAQASYEAFDRGFRTSVQNAKQAVGDGFKVVGNAVKKASPISVSINKDAAIIQKVMRMGEELSQAGQNQRSVGMER